LELNENRNREKNNERIETEKETAFDRSLPPSTEPSAKDRDQRGHDFWRTAPPLHREQSRSTSSEEKRV